MSKGWGGVNELIDEINELSGAINVLVVGKLIESRDTCYKWCGKLIEWRSY